MQQLPPPATSQEMYLAAVLDELRGLRADMAPGPREPSTNDQADIPLREPAPSKRPAKRGKKQPEG